MDSTSQQVPAAAFLEFGSTSIKFYLVPSSDDGGASTERELKIPWDLGYDVFEHQRISPRTISHCVSTLERLQVQFPEINFASVTAVGTAALREAQNSEIFQRLLREKVGLQIHVIAGGIEAFLLETGFRDMVEVYPTALFDLGGGSNEFIEYLSPDSTRKTSVPIGAIRLHCHLRRTRDLFEYIREGRRIVRTTQAEYFFGSPPRYRTLIGTGGTVRAIVQCLGRNHFGPTDIAELLQREIHGAVWTELAAHRRKLLLPGLISVEGLFTTHGVEEIVYRTASVKRGLISFTQMLPAMNNGG